VGLETKKKSANDSTSIHDMLETNLNFI